MSSGLKTAAFYSLPSFSLGFCGPQDPKSRQDLLNFANGGEISAKRIREIFVNFEAAYPYYQLIARKNKIKDSLDKRVVKAFWVGNKLLNAVNSEDLRNLIRTEFAKPGLLSKQEAERRARKVPDGIAPHHSFHVLFLGAITKRVKLQGTLLDLCRIGWGRVKELRMQNEELRIQYKPLILGKKIKLGKEIEKGIFWNKKIIVDVKVGDWVSFHWGAACEVLSPTEVKNLENYTQQTIDLVNLKKL